MSAVTAFCIRARFLRRALTKIRLRLRDTYVVRVLHVLKLMNFNCRCLSAFRSFGKRVRFCQRYWRQKLQMRALQHSLRDSQFQRQCRIRAFDLGLLFEKLKKDAGDSETTQVQNCRLEIYALENIPEAVRERYLTEYMRDYEVLYAQALKNYEKEAEVWSRSAARWRTAKPKKPRRRVLIPKDVLQVMVRDAVRTVVATL